MDFFGTLVSALNDTISKQKKYCFYCIICTRSQNTDRTIAATDRTIAKIRGVGRIDFLKYDPVWVRSHRRSLGDRRRMLKSTNGGTINAG